MSFYVINTQQQINKTRLIYCVSLIFLQIRYTFCSSKYLSMLSENYLLVYYVTVEISINDCELLLSRFVSKFHYPIDSIIG